MMQVLVSDTSVLIDLHRGLLLEAAFRLSYEFVVPDLLYKQELKDSNGERLLQLGLRVAELGSHATSQAVLYRRREPELSLADAFAVALAQTSGFVLLTGDRLMRILANQDSIRCHGVLWLLDQMHRENVATCLELHSGLTAIAAHPRCRLPKEEVALRLRQYGEHDGNAVA